MPLAVAVNPNYALKLTAGYTVPTVGGLRRRSLVLIRYPDKPYA